AGDLDDDAGDEVRVVDDDLNAHLRDEVDGVLGAAVDLGVPELPSVAAGLRDGHAVHADVREGLLDVAQPTRLDDGGDKLHEVTFSGVAAGTGSCTGSTAAAPSPVPAYADS